MTNILKDLQTSHPGEDPLLDRAAAEIRRLRQRVKDLLESNNKFEQQYRDEKTARLFMDKKYQDLRRLVLLEAAQHCDDYGLDTVKAEWLSSELRMKARG